MIKLTPAGAAAKMSGAGPWPQTSPRAAELVEEVSRGVPNTHRLECDLSDAEAAGPSSRAERLAPEVGVYVHFPWCIKKCPYCDFLSVPSAQQEIPHEQYADAVIAELRARREELGPQRLRTIFFGGGTPSLWKSKQLGRVLAAIREAFPAGPAPAEVTVECNPGSLGARTARALLDVGVNRLSIGVQGLDAERLRFLGRWHGVEQALDAVRAAIASGMPRVSADLIYGVAGESPEEAAREVRTLAELGLGHVSAYTLTIEPQTAFGARARKGRLPLAPDQAVAESFLAVDEALAACGLEHYEISNFARSGDVSRHNLGYWRGHDYLGLGTGAWGTVTLASGRVRYRTTPSPERFLGSRFERPFEVALDTTAVVEPLDAKTSLRERIMLGLRLADGFDLRSAAAELGVPELPPERKRALERLVSRGQIEAADGRLRIPPSKWLFADGIISELL
jgi:putative oxygen-independent coproporphyrinogen III oxidase